MDEPYLFPLSLGVRIVARIEPPDSDILSVRKLLGWLPAENIFQALSRLFALASPSQDATTRLIQQQVTQINQINQINPLQLAYDPISQSAGLIYKRIQPKFCKQLYATELDITCLSLTVIRRSSNRFQPSRQHFSTAIPPIRHNVFS